MRLGFEFEAQASHLTGCTTAAQMSANEVASGGFNER